MNPHLVSLQRKFIRARNKAEKNPVRRLGVHPFAFYPGLRNVTPFTRMTLIGFCTCMFYLARRGDFLLLRLLLPSLFLSAETMRSRLSHRVSVTTFFLSRVLSTPGRHDGTPGYFLASYETFQGRFRPDRPRSFFLFLFPGYVARPLRKRTSDFRNRGRATSFKNSAGCPTLSFDANMSSRTGNAEG